MSITLTLPDGIRYLKHARTQPLTQDRDLLQYRPPFSTTWRVAGSGHKQARDIGIRIEVWAGADFATVTYDGEIVTYDGDTVVAQTALVASTPDAVSAILDAVLADAEVATQIETPFGTWNLAAFRSGIATPIRAGGFRLDLVWLEGEPYTPTSSIGAGGEELGADDPSGGEEPTTIAGVGSDSDSLTTHPKLGDITEADYYVDKTVSSSGDGTTLATAFKTLDEGLAAIDALGGGGRKLAIVGDGVIYNLSSTITRNTAWTSRTIVCGYGTDRPILDGGADASLAPQAGGLSADDSGLAFSSAAANETWHRIWLRRVPLRGAGIDGQAMRVYQSTNVWFSDVRVSHCGNDGIWFYEATGGGAHDHRIWRLGDGSSADTNSPDGQVATGGGGASYSDGVQFLRFAIANAPDDGGDLFRCRNGKFKDGFVYDCGRYWNGNTGGDGNGLKVGGDTDGNDNSVEGCLTVNNRNNGIDGNLGDSIDYTKNTSAGNGALGFDCNGDNAAEDGTAADNISWNNGSAGNQGSDYGAYVGANVTDTSNNWTTTDGDPLFADVAGGDYSLDTGSPGIGSASDGGNKGASTIALEIAKEFLSWDLT